LDRRGGKIEGRRKLRTEELRNFYSSPNIIRMIELKNMSWARYVARMGEKENAYRTSEFRILMEMSDGKIPLGRHRRDWGNNIKTDFRDTG
jgi:hypothetical protein